MTMLCEEHIWTTSRRCVWRGSRGCRISVGTLLGTLQLQGNYVHCSRNFPTNSIKIEFTWRFVFKNDEQYKMSLSVPANILVVPTSISCMSSSFSVFWYLPILIIIPCILTLWSLLPCTGNVIWLPYCFVDNNRRNILRNLYSWVSW